MNHRIKIILTVIALLSTCHATAQITETKLIASDGAFYDNFGAPVSVSGNYALVGAPGDDNGNGAQAGAAYIFRYDGSNWVEQTKLTSSDGSADDYFGVSVSLSGDYALVGADGDDDNGGVAGSAYIFHYDGSNWVEHTKLTASDGSTNDYFGYSVSLSGNHAIVGALYESNVNGGSAGAAYIFHYDGSNWVEQAKLIASDGDSLEAFGYSVSLSGDYALVGAPYDSDNGPSAGSASIFHYDGSNWVEQTKLVASNGGIAAYFGWSVSLSGDFAILGALYDTNENGGGAGSAYIFHNDGSNWVEQIKLLASDGESYDWFGSSVSISGDYALVGVYGDDDKGDDGGSAYLFQYDGSNWVEQTKLMASHGRAYDQFGSSVSLSGNYAIVGAYGDDDNGESAGSAYVYTGFAMSAGISCDAIRFFNAKCNMNGAAQAMVKMVGDFTGETVTFDLDGDDYVSNVMSNGTNSIAKLTVPHAGMGSHTVTLEDPSGCYSPVMFNCQVDAPVDPEWDALWAEYDALRAASFKTLPAETKLLGNYPNPFNPSTTIRYSLSVDSPVSIRVYNMLGQEVATLVDGFQKAGEQSVTWNGTNTFGQGVASGLYIYRLQTGSSVMSQKMLFAK